jgi:hypothetical protein
MDPKRMHWTHHTCIGPIKPNKQINLSMSVPSNIFFVDGTSRRYFMNARSVLRVTTFGNHPWPTSGKASAAAALQRPTKINLCWVELKYCLM